MPRINWAKTYKKQTVEENTMRARANGLADSDPEKAARLKKAADDATALRKHHQRLQGSDG